MVAPLHPPSAPGVATYRRREPEKTVLYQILQEHLETFRARAETDRPATTEPFGA